MKPVKLIRKFYLQDIKNIEDQNNGYYNIDK